MRATLRHIITKPWKDEDKDKERFLEVAKEIVNYKGEAIRLTADCTSKPTEAKDWSIPS